MLASHVFEEHRRQIGEPGVCVTAAHRRQRRIVESPATAARRRRPVCSSLSCRVRVPFDAGLWRWAAARWWAVARGLWRGREREASSEPQWLQPLSGYQGLVGVGCTHGIVLLVPHARADATYRQDCLEKVALHTRWPCAKARAQVPTCVNGSPCSKSPQTAETDGPRRRPRRRSRTVPRAAS